MTVRNIKTREGYEFWDKLCAIPRYGFIHSPDNSRVLKAEGIGNWIDMHAAQEVVDAAQDEVNGLRAERDQLRAEVEALRAERQGKVLVPNEPTIEMIAALAFDGDADLAIGHAAICHDVERTYKAMLDAAMAAKEGE